MRLGDLQLAKSTNIFWCCYLHLSPGRADPAVRPDFGVMAVLMSVLETGAYIRDIGSNKVLCKYADMDGGEKRKAV